jgi:pimeloyl-ACP methyl ester carboxylesterase
MPLRLDRPVNIDVEEICSACTICAEACPAGAIFSRNDKRVVRGVKKWKLNDEVCYRFALTAGAICGLCVAACPLGKTEHWQFRVKQPSPWLEPSKMEWQKLRVSQNTSIDDFGYLYFPSGLRVPLDNAATHFIEVEEGIRIGCGFWTRGKEFPSVLYFHGNGETVTDHDWIAQLYTQRGANLFVSDYRGYGLSDGKPTITNLIRDSHVIFEGFKKLIEEGGYEPKLFLIGRSLGSIPAVELAYHYQDELKGLIIESGSAGNFSRLWSYLKPSEKDKLTGDKFLNSQKIKAVHIPTFIIHGELDQIIPVQEGLKLYENSGAVDKDILIISGADHNDLMIRGHRQYFTKIEEFIKKNS